MIATLADYRLVTGDTVTLDATVTTLLARAQARAEELCGREFDAAARTETLPVDDDGRVWPIAYPVTAVTAPVGATPDTDGIGVVTTSAGDFSGLFEDVWGFPVTALPGSGLDVTTVAVTYTGGYALGTAPQGLVDAVCELASRYAAPADTRGVPAGVTSVTLGGDASQSYSGRALGGSSGVPSALRQQILRYRHAHARRAD